MLKNEPTCKDLISFISRICGEMDELELEWCPLMLEHCDKIAKAARPALQPLAPAKTNKKKQQASRVQAGGQFLAASNHRLAGCVEQRLNKTEVLSHGAFVGLDFTALIDTWQVVE